MAKKGPANFGNKEMVQYKRKKQVSVSKMG